MAVGPLLRSISARVISSASAYNSFLTGHSTASATAPLGENRVYSAKAFSTQPAKNLRDHKRRLLAANYELRRKLYKAFCKDADLPSDIRDKQRYKLSKLPRNSSFTRIRNRCIFTGRPRAVYAFFRTSRIVFRGLASRGSLMGVKKSSW